MVLKVIILLEVINYLSKKHQKLKTHYLNYLLAWEINRQKKSVSLSQLKEISQKYRTKHNQHAIEQVSVKDWLTYSNDLWQYSNAERCHVKPI